MNDKLIDVGVHPDYTVLNIDKDQISVGITNFLLMGKATIPTILYKGNKYRRLYSDIIPEKHLNDICSVQIYEFIQQIKTVENDIFNKDFIKSIGFEVTGDDGVYGKAESIRARGKTLLAWNREGTTMNYFGDKIEFGMHFSIKEDAGTRTVFSGIIRSQDDIKKVLTLMTGI